MQASYAKKLSWRLTSKAGVICIVKSAGKNVNWRVYTVYFVQNTILIQNLKQQIWNDNSPYSYFQNP